MPADHVPPTAERPDVEVLVDGEWLVGEVRLQRQEDDGRWRFMVQYRPAGTHTRRLEWFEAGDVRADEGYGRHSSR